MRIGAWSPPLLLPLTEEETEEEAAPLRRRAAVGAEAASLAAARAAAEAEAEAEVEVEVSSSDFSSKSPPSPPAPPRPILLPPDAPLALIFAVALLTRMLVSVRGASEATERGEKSSSLSKEEKMGGINSFQRREGQREARGEKMEKKCRVSQRNPAKTFTIRLVKKKH